MPAAVNSWFGSTQNSSGTWDTKTEQNSFARLWRAFMLARIVIASVLVVLQAVIYAMGNVGNRWSITVCTAYFFATLAVRLWASPRPPGRSFDAQ